MLRAAPGRYKRGAPTTDDNTHNSGTLNLTCRGGTPWPPPLLYVGFPFIITTSFTLTGRRDWGEAFIITTSFTLLGRTIGYRAFIITTSFTLTGRRDWGEGLHYHDILYTCLLYTSDA